MAPISRNSLHLDPVVTISDAIAGQAYPPPILWDPKATLDLGTVQDSGNAHEHPVSVLDTPVITPNDVPENENFSHYSPRSLAPRDDFGQQSKADQASEIIMVIVFGLMAAVVVLLILFGAIQLIIDFFKTLECCSCHRPEQENDKAGKSQSQSNMSADSIQLNTLTNSGETRRDGSNGELPTYQDSTPVKSPHVRHGALLTKSVTSDVRE